MDDYLMFPPKSPEKPRSVNKSYPCLSVLSQQITILFLL